MKNFVLELEKEHKRGLIQVGFLSDAINRMQDEESLTYEINLIRKILLPLIEDVREHTEKEEVEIFPEFMIRKVDTKLIAELIIEHNSLLETMSDLKNILNNKIETSNKEQIEKLKLSLKKVINVFLNHIKREEKELFPLVNNLK